MIKSPTLNLNIHSYLIRRKELRMSTGISYYYFRIKIDVNKKAIADLRNEVDNLKLQLHRVNCQIE
jgi:hypothetical protein